MRRILIVLGGLLALSCLASCKSVEASYVEADRATYEAIAPEYRKYVEADAALADFQKDIRLQTLATWEHRLTQAEEAK